MKQNLSVQDYIDGIKAKNISILSKAVTLIESTNENHQEKARELLQAVLPLTGNAKRIGISGTPGVGKSTLLENFGMHLLQDKKSSLAVLAVDPTSQLTGGSILGDKTRMQNLAIQKNAFIRPSPNGSTLGGVASKTREVMLLCDAFGFEYIFIETVGVGQSEIEVSNIVDFFILLIQPGSGDELQGIKRGILEVSDLVIINKADGDQVTNAKVAKHDYQISLDVLQEKKQWKTPIILCSSVNKTGFEDIQNSINEYFKNIFNKSFREKQIKKWLEDLLIFKYKQSIKKDRKIQKKMDALVQNQSDLIEEINSLFNKTIGK